MSILKLEPQLANSTANFAFGNVFASNFYYANGALFSGGGSGTVKYTANSNPPTSNNSPGDQWFNTTSQVLYEYINDGTGNYWVDILSPTISSTSANTFVSGNSNITIQSNGNISFAVAGTGNVFKVTSSNTTVTGDLAVTGNITGNINLSNLSVTGYTTASNGFYSQSVYTGSFTDGIVVDYLTGNGRISVGSVDGLQVYNGGVASNLIFSISSTGIANVTNTLNVSNGANIAGNLAVTGNLSVVGSMTLQQTYEVVNTVNNPTGTVTYDFTIGGTYYHTGATAAWTANITNVPTTANRILVVAFIINQGATGYVPSAYQINGSAVTVKWVGGSAFTAGSSKYDIVSLSCMYTGGTWIVFGQGASYS